MINHYDILGVSRGASDDEIRERFRDLARSEHPDKFSGAAKAPAEQRFQQLTEAVNVLTNPARRRAHDMELEKGREMSQDPEQIARAYLNRGVKAYKDKEWRLAAEAFDMAVKHTPGNAKAHYYLAMALAQEPQSLRAAVTAAERAIALDGMNPTYLKDGGKLCLRAGLKAKAEKYLADALKWDEEDSEIKSLLAQVRAPARKAGLLDSFFKKG